MTLFSELNRFLTGSVGNNLDNNAADIRNVKRVLSSFDYYNNENENDFITRSLDESIRSFQSDHGLRIDGALFPGGETEREFISQTQIKKPQSSGIRTLEGNMYDPITNPDGYKVLPPQKLVVRDDAPSTDHSTMEASEHSFGDGSVSSHREERIDDYEPMDDVFATETEEENIEAGFDESAEEDESEDLPSSEPEQDTSEENTEQTSSSLPTVNKEAVLQKVIEQQVKDAQDLRDYGHIVRDEQGLPAGTFGQSAQNVDATGRQIRNDVPPAPERKPQILSTQERKRAILENKEADFKIVSNPNADGSKPWYAIDSFSEVKSNEKIIEREAKKVGVDPEMVKAIVHLETTQGAYDRIAKKFGNRNETIRPMNVHAKYWKDLGFSRKDLEDPEKNIQAGVKLLKRIQDRIPNANTAKVATVYNSLRAKRVSDYGARVEQILKEKPWKK